MRSLFDWMFERSADKVLLTAALRVLVKQAGGSVVIPLEELDASEGLEVDVRHNEDPEGVRIIVREK